MITTTTLQKQDTTGSTVLYMALELSNTKWKVGFSNGEKIRQVTITARDLGELEDEIEKARERFCLKDDVQIVSCYEAGRDGFWIHRYLTDRGIENLVVDSSSIEVSRRSRRAKTDRLDLRSLVRMLIRYCGGERGLWSVVREPSVEDEDARRLHRELERLRKERISHRNRIRSLLILHGIVLKDWKDFPEYLNLLKTGDGHLLPSGIKSEIEREFFRMEFLEQQIKELEAEQMERIRNPQTESDKKIKALVELCGIGVKSAWVFVMEFLGWRKFKNRRQLASLAGLSPTPYDSGGSRREQGISKAGNRRARSMLIEISWIWLRYQPGSKLSLWFNKRFANGGKRMRRIGIVAVARKLLIAMWKMLEYGEIPEGAVVK